jgi:hypothetical protein
LLDFTTNSGVGDCKDEGVDDKAAAAEGEDGDEEMGAGDVETAVDAENKGDGAVCCVVCGNTTLGA